LSNGRYPLDSRVKPDLSTPTLICADVRSSGRGYRPVLGRKRAEGG
jgi:hypothetical protein